MHLVAAGAVGWEPGERETRTAGCRVIVVGQSHHIHRLRAEYGIPKEVGSMKSCSNAESGRSSRTHETPYSH